MKSILFSFLVLVASCSNKQEDLKEVSVQPEDTQDVVDLVIQEDTYSIWEDPCVVCSWYFCEDLSEVWQKQICVNECNEPKTIVYEGECEKKLECNPTQYLIETDVSCVDDEGRQGLQDKVCVKGIIKFTDCIANCGEEVCNGFDDDCDGETDEGQLNACGFCGIVPQETCDNIDNDCDGAVDEDIVRPCSTACEDNLEYCVAGNWVCTAKKPKEEVCNGLDDDCDGQIDEGIECFCQEKDLGMLVPCAEDPLVCGEGFKTCECSDELCTTFQMTDCLAQCHWFPDFVAEGEVCDPYLGKIIPEECNNHDDNCNELVDEDLYALCYSGPPQTMGVGICKPGFSFCKEGEWGNNVEGSFIPDFCLDEVPPMTEDICNGEDTNCDGIIEKELDPTDILFIVDMSGSMTFEINAVFSALSQFALYYSDSEVIRWGLVLIALRENDPETSFPIEKMKLQTNLNNFEDFMSSFAGIDPLQQSGGNEQSLDAIYFSIKNLVGGGDYDVNAATWLNTNYNGGSIPPKEEWEVEWREDTKRVIILFTDEKPQSYLFPQITESNVIAAIEAALDFNFYSFTSGFANLQWSSITDASTKAKMMQLTDSAEQMYGNLLQILDETACSGN